MHAALSSRCLTARTLLCPVHCVLQPKSAKQQHVKGRRAVREVLWRVHALHALLMAVRARLRGRQGPVSIAGEIQGMLWRGLGSIALVA
jgi:hypothetical protein